MWIRATLNAPPAFQGRLLPIRGGVIVNPILCTSFAHFLHKGGAKLGICLEYECDWIFLTAERVSHRLPDTAQERIIIGYYVYLKAIIMERTANRGHRKAVAKIPRVSIQLPLLRIRAVARCNSR